MCPINFRWKETYTPTMHSASLTLAHNALHSPSLYIIIMVRPSPARRVRPHEDHARSRQDLGSRPRTSTCLHLPTSLSAVAVSFDSLRQLLCLSTLVVCSMGSTNHQRASAPRTLESQTRETPSTKAGAREGPP